MNAVSNVLKKSFLPAFGLLLTLVVIQQVRGAGDPSGHSGGALAALGIDAAAKAEPAPAPPAAGVVAEGRLVTYPGAEVVLASERPGTVVRLLVDEKDEVRRGQLVAELRADDLRAELAEARARVTEAEADIRFADVDTARAERLLAAQVGTPEALDRARRNHDAAYARRQTAAASAERIEALLAKTRLTAPLAGTVIVRAVQPGEHVEAGQPLVTVADLGRTRIEAEVDEFDAGRVALGSPVEVTVEGYTGQSWKGVVEEIPDAVTTRRLKPQNPGRPRTPASSWSRSPSRSPPPSSSASGWRCGSGRRGEPWSGAL